MHRSATHLASVAALFSAFACTGQTYSRPFVGSGAPIDLGALPACERPPVDTAGWVRIDVPDQSGLALRLPTDLPAQSTRLAGVRTTDIGESGSDLSVAVRRINIEDARDVPLIWLDGRGPLGDGGLTISCNDCMVSERRCVESIAGAARFVAIGRMEGWSSYPMTYATWEARDGVWQVVEVHYPRSTLGNALAVLRSVTIAR